jgi:Fic-DOC domain mobile mystery protein B
VGLNFQLINGQTPLDEEEKEGLLIPSVTTLQELNEFEQLGIENAIRWSIGRTHRREEILTEDFVKLVHRKMFGEVWAWAGEFRKSNKNIGVSWHDIPTALRTLLADCSYWIEHDTWPADEIALRFKHRIVQIHCFPNGNGRHSRLMGDILIEQVFNLPVFNWGGRGDLAAASAARVNYIEAIKAADRGEMSLLFTFSRS